MRTDDVITDNILLEFKNRMRISHSSEDSNLEWLLSSSYEAVKSICGEFSISENKEGRELVYERARYAYYDSVEYFETNFLSRLHSFGISLVVIEDETV